MAIRSIRPCLTFAERACAGGGPFFALVRRLATPRTLPPKEPGWRLRRLPTGHDAMITMPGQLTALLLELSSRRRTVLGSVSPGAR